MRLLLHICCANCGIVPIELLREQFNLTLFWYNPNIYPEEEYERRLKDVKELATIYKVPLSVETRLQQIDRETKLWFKLVKGLEKEPASGPSSGALLSTEQSLGHTAQREGGKRCQVCFQMRLEKTAQFAKSQNFDYLATTLTMGPQKKAEKINALGKKIADKYGIDFYSADFKKENGFQKSIELSKKYNFYRQNYCGCIYSKRQL